MSRAHKNLRITTIAIGALLSLLGGRPAAGQSIPGFVYTLRVTGSGPNGIAGISNAPGSESYVGKVSSTPGRGRLDVIDGGVDGLFAKGDYLLFDSAEVVVVHPAQQEFVTLSREASSRAMDRLTALGVTMKLDDEKVQLDSVGLGDTIAGTPTTRMRLVVGFNMEMRAPTMVQRIGTETVTDYWLGNIAGMPVNPLLKSNGLAGPGMSGMFKTLSERVDSVSRLMGHRIALRTISNTHINGGPGQGMSSRQSTEVSDVARQPVAAATLVMPAAFKAAALPGMALETPTGDGAKWKAPPPVR